MFAGFPDKFQSALRNGADNAPEVAAAVSSLVLTPAAVTATALAFWRLASDMNFTNEFFISKGLFSRWQVWLAVAVLLKLSANHINRNSRPTDTTRR